jgi:predicted TIM-barrel fold metal-dependent hydrolase
VLDYMPSDVYQQMGKSFLDKKGNGPTGLLNNQPGLTYQAQFGRVPHQQPTSEPTDDTPIHRQTQLVQRALDSMAIDYMVCFPTPMLTLGMHPQAEVEVQLSWAFNRWLTEEVLPQDDRLMGLLYLPFNTPEECPKIIEEFADKKGVSGFTCTSVRSTPVHHNRNMRTYAMLEERGLPMSFHAAFNWSDGSTAQLNRFLSMHAISFVHCNIIHMTNWVINGLPERFPNLNVMWIESGLAWLPYLMQRLDSEYMMRSSEAPLLKRRPSEYMREMYYSSQPLETVSMKLTEATFDAINADTQLCWCSDWPHWDFDTPSVIWDLPFLSEESKKNILGRNAAKLFNLKDPYAQAQSQAAE